MQMKKPLDLKPTCNQNNYNLVIFNYNCYVQINLKNKKKIKTQLINTHNDAVMPPKDENY